MRGLRDKVAIVTGGAGTIGSSILERLAAEGCIPVCLDIRPPIAGAAATGGRPFWQADLADEAEVQAAVDGIVATYGRVDLLVNAAGVVGPTSEVIETAPEDFDAIVRSNLRGVFVSMRAVIGLMRRQGHGGAVVNLASTAVSRIRPGRSLYAMTKSAIIAMSTAAALENAEYGIRVNCVSPGPIESEMYRQMLRNEDGAATAPPAGSGRLGQPDDVASLVAFLLSSDARHCTGHNYFVDGGVAA